MSGCRSRGTLVAPDPRRACNGIIASDRDGCLPQDRETKQLNLPVKDINQ